MKHMLINRILGIIRKNTSRQHANNPIYVCKMTAPKYIHINQYILLKHIKIVIHILVESANTSSQMNNYLGSNALKQRQSTLIVRQITIGR